VFPNKGWQTQMGWNILHQITTEIMTKCQKQNDVENNDQQKSKQTSNHNFTICSHTKKSSVVKKVVAKKSQRDNPIQIYHPKNT
jgi:hypothetical protein